MTYAILGLGDFNHSHLLLDEEPVHQAQGAVHAGGEVEIVGGDHGGDSGLANEAQELLEDALGRRWIEVAGWLVGQKDLGAVRHGPRDGDALLLAARQLRREVIHSVLEADMGERLVRPHRRFGDLGDERDVFVGGEVGDEIVELEDETDMLAPIGGEAPVVEAGAAFLSSQIIAISFHNSRPRA